MLLNCFCSVWGSKAVLSAQKLHAELLQGVAHACGREIDTTPLGRSKALSRMIKNTRPG